MIDPDEVREERRQVRQARAAARSAAASATRRAGGVRLTLAPAVREVAGGVASTVPVVLDPNGRELTEAIDATGARSS
ncbi:MAG: hypothetical protein ACK52I_11745 [Pseudomonadota bacterium]|jgi:hypothetical protein